MIARLIVCSTETGKSGGSPKRMLIATSSLFFNISINPPNAYLTGVIISPITYSGASCNSAARHHFCSILGAFSRTKRSTSTQCWATENPYLPRVCPFHRVTRANPWAISSISISSGEVQCHIERRPLNIRCQARGSGTPIVFFSTGLRRFSVFFAWLDLENGIFTLF